jgi:hypothetical protein
MNRDSRRFALVARGRNAPDRNWNDGRESPERVVFVNSFTVLRYLLSNGPDAATHDVARIIIDHAATASDFLELLATLPHEVTADIVLIDGSSAFLNAIGRGGDRVLYRLVPEDIDFYLDTHGLRREERHYAAA